MNRRDFLKTSAVTGGSVLFFPPLVSAVPNDSSGTTGPLVTLPSRSTSTPTPLPDLSPAKWLWYPCGRCLANTFVLFRQELVLASKPLRATGWIAAESRYRLDVNGQRQQWGPAPTDPRWAEADPVDLTHILQVGPNVIGATVLYFGHGDGTWAIGKPGFLFRLEVKQENGTKLVVVSDSSWQVQLCRAWQPGHYKRWFLRALQEEFDARKYPHGWTLSGFPLGPDWLPAMVLEGSPNKPALSTKFAEYALGFRNSPENCELRPRSVPMLHEPRVPVRGLAESMWITWIRPAFDYFECRVPDAFKVDRASSATSAATNQWQITLDNTRAAALTFELTEQVVGWPYFTIEAPAGTVVELMLQEGHEVGGPPLLNSSLRDAWTRFTCKEGVNSFECFDFESLRWLQLHIRDAKGLITIRDVGVRRRLYPWPNPPVLRSNEPALQLLFNASVNTLNNAAQETIVDGMGRERQQYSGDCGHQLNAIRLVFGETQSPARFLETWSQGQTHDGYFLDCWPGYDRLARIVQRQLGLFHFGAILDHGVQFAFDCWHHYQYTGDLTALREPYPRLLRFSNYLPTILNRDGDGLLPVENLGLPSVWMDYQAYHQGSGVEPPFTQRHKQCAFNLFVAAMMQHAMAPLCLAMGGATLAKALSDFGKSLEATAVKRFWSAEHGTFIHNLPWLAEEKTPSMCDRSLATAVLFDQCPSNNIAGSIKALADCPKEMGLSYPANAGWRLRALAKGGRSDVVIKDFRERWATMASVKLNNTLQEAWKATPDSSSQWSHCAVAPLYVTYQDLAGIRPLAPGFGRVEIFPCLGDLESLELVAYTPKGPITFSATTSHATRQLTVGLPPDCEGELVLRPSEKLTLPRLSAEASQGYARYRLTPGVQVTVPLPFT